MTQEYIQDEIVTENDYKVTIYNMNKYELLGCFSPHIFMLIYLAYSYIFV